jgi:hypothetical protein
VKSNLKMIWKVLAVAIFAMAGGCAHNAQPVRVSMQGLPPLSGKIKIATTIVPRSQKFKVAVLTFIDQTGRAPLVVDPIADMLTTELFGVSRFELYDRQDLVEETHARTLVGQNQTATLTQQGSAEHKTSQQYDKVSRGKVDGILLGYITSFKMNETEEKPATVGAPDPGRKKTTKNDPRVAAAVVTPPTSGQSATVQDGTGEFECDFRIVNTLAGRNDRAAGQADADVKVEGLKELVVFSDKATVKFRMKGGNIEITRDDVKNIANEIKKKFPDFAAKKKINITGLQERTLSLNVGRTDGVQQGFTGYVVEKDEVTHVYRYLAEFVIINVFEDAATAVVLADSPEPDSLSNILANIKVGSEAVIK